MLIQCPRNAPKMAAYFLDPPATPTYTPTNTFTATWTPSNTPTFTYTPTATATPYMETEEDDFDGPELALGWEWYVPKAGPTYTLSVAPGAFLMSLPAGDTFEHWGTTDDTPQLRQTGLGDLDWAIEARLENVYPATDAYYWAALEVGFGQYDQIWFGMGDTGELGVIRVNDCCSLFAIP